MVITYVRRENIYIYFFNLQKILEDIKCLCTVAECIEG